MTKTMKWDIRISGAEATDLVARNIWTGKTIADHARQMMEDDPGQSLLTINGREYSVEEIVDRASALARGILAIGVKSGETIALQLPNWIEAAEIDLAAALGGFVVAPIVPIYRGAELRYILKDSRTRLIFTPVEYRSNHHLEVLQTIRKDVPDLEHIVVVRGESAGHSTYEELVSLGRRSDAHLPGSDANSLKQLIYTSGTSGTPKGVMWTHNQARRTLHNSATAWNLKPGSLFLVGTPIGHVTGFTYGIDNCFYLGMRSVLMERWDADEAVRLIDQHKVQAMLGATPFLSDLVEAAQRANSKLPSLEIFFCGGAAVPPNLVRRSYDVFEKCRTFRVFGSTECPMITQGCPEDPELAATTDGRIYDYEVKIVDDEGHELKPGSDGEIVARGPAMFLGYTDPEATREAFDPQGYFRTGDIGKVTPNGILTVTGRKKDLIIRGGENLSAKEIEDALHTHPAIREAAVIAMPLDRLGEGVFAYLIASGTEQPDVKDLSEHLRNLGLAPQKWPERVAYVDDLPRTPSGKVQKYVLRDSLSVTPR